LTFSQVNCPMDNRSFISRLTYYITGWNLSYAYIVFL